MALEEMTAVAEPEIEAVEPEAVEPETEAVTETPETEPVVEEVDGDGRKIPQQYRELFKTDKDLKSMWFTLGAFKEDFPGGPKEAKAFLESLETFGGRQGVADKFKELQSSAEEMGQLNQMISAGDPKVIEKFAETSPEGFSKLAPEVLTKFSQVAPEECNKMLCGVIANTLNSGGFANLLEKASLYLEVGKPEQAIQVLQSMQQWGKAFGEAASKPVTPKEAPKDDSVKTERAQWEETKFTDGLNSKVGEIGQSLIQKELEPFTKGRTLSDTKKELVMEAINTRLDKALKDDKSFQDKIRPFVTRKDVDGATKIFRSQLMERAPAIVASVAREVLGSPVAPKPVTAARTTPTSAPIPVKDLDPRKALFQEIASR